MGDLGAHPPCCAANGFTEGEHDADCDLLLENIARRLHRVTGLALDVARRALACAPGPDLLDREAS